MESYKQCADYSADYYVPRSLSKQTFDLDLLKNDFESTVVVINDATKEDLESLGVDPAKIVMWKGGSVVARGDQNLNIMIPDGDLNDEEFFNEVCHSLPNDKAVHMFRLSKNVLIPSKSRGTIEEVAKFINSEETVEYLDQVSFVEHEMKVDRTVSFNGVVGCSDAVIMADDPGTGKSFALAQMAHKIKQDHQNTWVARIDLNKHAMSNRKCFHLDNIVSEEVENSVDYLYEMVKRGNSKLEYNILKHMCKKSRKVVVLFDSYDDACPDYKERVLEFLKLLRMYGKIKIFVATRLHEKEDLELQMESFSYKLNPFSLENQINFLDRLWKSCLKNLFFQEEIVNHISKKICDETHKNLQLVKKGFVSQKEDFIKRCSFEDAARKLLDNVRQFIKDFFEVPLNTYMLGIVWFDHNFDLENDLQLGRLFEMFFQIKCNIFFQQKCGSSRNPSAEVISQVLNMNMCKAHKIVSSKKGNISEEEDNFTELERALGGYQKEISDRIGLIRRFRFTHTIWEEFFYSFWFTDSRDASQSYIEGSPAFRQFLEFHFKRRSEMDSNADEDEFEQFWGWPGLVE